MDLEGSPNKSERLADTRLMYYVGLIDTEQVSKFQKMVFRMTRGKVLVHSRDVGNIPSVFDHLPHKYKSLDLKDAQKSKSKSILYMFFIGKDSVLGKKLKVVASIFDVFNIPIPPNPNDKTEILKDANKSRDEMIKVIEKTIDEIHNILDYLVRVQQSGVSRIDELQYLINRERSISRAISHLEPYNELYSLKLWIDSDSKQDFIGGLIDFCNSKPNIAKPIINTINFDMQTTKPPTKFDLNEFTAPFQNIVDTYAIPKYKEINPTPFTAATFPFLFGVMFGDACHGLIIFVFGLYLLLRGEEFKRKGGIYEQMASLRYMITLLGFFSFYNGIVYNDFAALPLLSSPSCFDSKQVDHGHGLEEKFVRREGCVYPFGIDWVWSLASNEVPYLNSFKMKVSIILGVIQMLFGIILKGLNAIHFSNPLDLIFEVIPQFLFLGGLFGYMSVLIVIKWLTSWEGKTPPAIINTFTSLTKVEEKNVLLIDAPTQELVQKVIVCRPPSPRHLSRLRAADALPQAHHPLAQEPPPRQRGSGAQEEDRPGLGPHDARRHRRGAADPGPGRQHALAHGRQQVRHAARVAREGQQRGARRPRRRLLRRAAGPPRHRDDRVHLGHDLEHRELPAALGALPGALSTLHGSSG